MPGCLAGLGAGSADRTAEQRNMPTRFGHSTGSEYHVTLPGVVKGVCTRNLLLAFFSVRIRGEMSVLYCGDRDCGSVWHGKAPIS